MDLHLRRFIVMLAVLLTLGTTDFAAATLATPAPVLDYPELKITATGTELDLPAEVAAGHYLVTLDNRGKDGMDAQIIAPPDGHTAADVVEALAAPEPVTWLYDATWAGGPTVLAGRQGQTIVDLAAGAWVIVADGYSPATLTVTAADSQAPAPVDPEAEVAIALHEYDFVGLEGGVQPGKQVWKVTNVGDQPHFLELIKVPGPVTVDQVMAILMAMGNPDATPAPGAINPATIEGVGGIATISPGTTGWYVTDLAPGTYIALCFVPDRDAAVPHAMMGIVQVFTVAEAGTPVP